MRCVAFPFPAVLVTALICLDPASAADAPTAKEVFQKAAEHQGRVDAEKIRDVHVSVPEGRTQARENGTLTEHRVQSDVWYRSADRAFRIKYWSRTEPKKRSERSVIGRKYFERAKSVIELKPGNELDAQSIKTVKEDRAHFENVLGLMLLGRLDTEETRFVFASDKPVTLAEDMPENKEFRADPKALHHVVDVLRDQKKTLRLYINAKSFEIKKAEIFGAKDKRLERVFYFGLQVRESALGLSIPRNFIEYSRVPTDEKAKREAWTLMGELRVTINGSLADDVFVLTDPKPKR